MTEDAPALDLPDGDALALLAIPAFLRRNKGAYMETIDKMTHSDEAESRTPLCNNEAGRETMKQAFVAALEEKGLELDADKLAETTPMEELSLEEAQERLKKMVEKRDALVVAISAHKKYVQKLIGQL